MAFERDMEVGRKIHENIQKLAQFDATLATTKQILEVLQVGLQTLDEIQKNWSKLLRYFETIKILLDVALGKPLAQFVEDGKVCSYVCTTIVAVGLSGILKGKQKLGVTFNSDKLGSIDFTKF